MKTVDDDRLEAVVAAEPDAPSLRTNPPRRTPWSSQRIPAWATNATLISWSATLLIAALIATAALWPRRSAPPRLAHQSTESPPVSPAESETTDSEPDDLGDLDSALPSRPVADHPPAEPNEPNSADPAGVAAAPDHASPPAGQDEPLDALLTSESSPAAEKASAVVLPEPPPPVDFDGAFAQPLKQFRQNRAISRAELLELLAELLGAPIRYDAEQLGAAAQSLEQKISLDLSDTTVGRVLDKVLEKTGLEYDRERDGLRLRVKDDAAATKK